MTKEELKLGDRAVNEFKKSLWHDASKRPRAISDIIVRSVDFYSIFHFEYDDDWKEISSTIKITHWCYIDDLLPKKGGEE